MAASIRYNPLLVGANELPASLIDLFEFYLLNYFTPAIYEQTPVTRTGRQLLEDIGCTQCHVPALPLTTDRRVADVETVYDPGKGVFNTLFATATPIHDVRQTAQGCRR